MIQMINILDNLSLWNPGQFDSDGKIRYYVDRNRVDGYLTDNVRELEDSALTFAEG